LSPISQERDIDSESKVLPLVVQRLSSPVPQSAEILLSPWCTTA